MNSDDWATLFALLGGLLGAGTAARMTHVGIVQGARGMLHDLFNAAMWAGPPVLGFMIGSGIVLLLYFAGRKLWGGESA